jgi:hypothetical protein
MPAANALPFLQRIDLKNVLSFGPETDGPIFTPSIY